MTKSKSNSSKLTVVITTEVTYYLEKGGTDTETICLTSFAAEYSNNAVRQKSLKEHIVRLSEKVAKDCVIAPNSEPTTKATKATKMTAQEKRDRAIFGDDQQKAYEQFTIVKNELTAISITVGRLLKNQDSIKCWILMWDGEKAGLYWTPNEWTVESLEYGRELKGIWEDFDLESQLECNDVSFTEYEE